MTEFCLVQVFRSSRREGAYLYVALNEGLARVPDALLAQFGTPEPALRLKLTAARKLAQASAGDVLSAIGAQGYYLQLPPSPESRAREMHGREARDD